MDAPLANKTIITTWATGWAASAAAAVPFVLDNEVDSETDTGWVRVVTRERSARQETIGRNRRNVRRDGTIYIQCFSPVAGGAAAGLELARIARSIIEGVTVDGVRMLVGSVRPADNDGKWWNVTVEVPFWYREALTT